MNRSKLTIALYLLLVFVSGAVVGVVGHNLYDARVKAAGVLSPEEYRQKYVDEMRQRISLDDSQVQRLEQILDTTEQKFKEFRARHKPEAKGIHQSQVDAIRAMLSPEQLPKYEEYREERENERKKKGKH